MRELLFAAVSGGLSGLLFWHLGVRAERGRQARIAEIERGPVALRKHGVRLSRVVIRR